MKPATVDYHRAESREHALSLLQEYGDEAKLLAGGQSLVPLMSFRLVQPGVLIDLNRVADLAHMGEDKDHLVIGSMVRQRAVETSSMIRDQAPLLSEALGHVGHVTIRNRGTIGGSLAHADPAAELPVALLVLDGEVVVDGVAGQRIVKGKDFFIGTLTTSLAPDELLTAVRVPRPAMGVGVGLAELSRRHGDFAIVVAMALVQLAPDGTCRAVRIAVGGAQSIPARLPQAESILVGVEPGSASIEEAAQAAASAVSPVADVHAPAEYRREMTRVFVKRALTQAAKRAKDGEV